MSLKRKTHSALAALILLVQGGIGASLQAQGFFDDPDSRHATVERYRSPIWGEIRWQPTPVLEALIAGADGYGMAMAIASNFHAPEQAPPHYVRAMALTIADQLQHKAKPVRLADYQLKFRREPAPVPTWSDRDTLGETLWSLAWKSHDASTDSESGMLLLDLAAAFDPFDPESMKRYRTLSDGRMELRWLAAVRLPEGIDAPDIEGEEEAEIAYAEEDLDGVSPEIVAEPAAFSFALKRSSILVPAANGGFARLVGEAIQYDPEMLKQRYREINRQRSKVAKAKGVEAKPYAAPALAVDFRVGANNGNAAARILGELEIARSQFLRARAGVEIPKGMGVEFHIEDGVSPTGGQLLSAAAGVLLESMAKGTVLSDQAAGAGLLGFGSSLQLGDAPLCSTLRPPSSGAPMQALLAVADTAVAEVADMAALGDYEMLTKVQLLACRSTREALAMLSSEATPDHARAYSLFSEIAHAAKRTPLDSLLQNPLVHSRLGEALALCPAHLSAAILLKAGKADSRSLTASLTGSVTRLNRMEAEVRDWVQGHLGSIAEGEEISDAACAVALAELRFLRPRLHPETRQYADGLSELVDDLRSSVRSGGSVSNRRAEGLKSALDSLSLQVATLGVSEP